MTLSMDENGIIRASGEDAGTFTPLIMIGEPGMMTLPDGPCVVCGKPLWSLDGAPNVPGAAMSYGCTTEGVVGPGMRHDHCPPQSRDPR